MLVAEFRSEEAKSVVKLAATDLISRNFVSGSIRNIRYVNGFIYLLDGIQLLYLIDQGINASKLPCIAWSAIEKRRILEGIMQTYYYITQASTNHSHNLKYWDDCAGTLSSVYLFPLPIFIRVR